MDERILGRLYGLRDPVEAVKHGAGSPANRLAQVTLNHHHSIGQVDAGGEHTINRHSGSARTGFWLRDQPLLRRARPGKRCLVCHELAKQRGGSYVDEITFYRSEEHTSELQSLRHLVCRLLLEKKK